MGERILKRELEALLFATDSPLTVGRLKKIFPGAETPEIKAAIAELQDEYDDSGHAFTVVEFGGGWQIATKPEFSPIVEKMLKTRRFTRLSKAGLEVLAIIAYRQPITRLEIDDIRGVNSSGAISTLTERNLITVVGRSAMGNPLLYGTTREFLNHLGLQGPEPAAGSAGSRGRHGQHGGAQGIRHPDRPGCHGRGTGGLLQGAGRRRGRDRRGRGDLSEELTDAGNCRTRNMKAPGIEEDAWMRTRGRRTPRTTKHRRRSDPNLGREAGERGIAMTLPMMPTSDLPA